jgi:hypothetical protein
MSASHVSFSFFVVVYDNKCDDSNTEGKWWDGDMVQ